MEAIHADSVAIISLSGSDRWAELGIAEWAAGDAALNAAAIRAQHAAGTNFAINIFDGDLQRTVTGTPGAAVHISPRSASLCDRVLADQPQMRIFATADASVDERLSDSPWVDSRWGTIRFYASAALRDSAGLAVGTVCLWSEQVVRPEAHHVSRLIVIRDEVLQLMQSWLRSQTESNPVDGHRPVAEKSAWLASQDVRPRREPARVVTEGRSAIDAVIDRQTVRTVFQPVVHLDTGQVSGFEALSRGPADSALESPAALLRAAEAAGRLGELDWLCRVHAMQAAAEAGLHPSLSWLINVEPAGLATECPPHLLAGLARARTELRVILEVVERDVEGYAIDLVHATDRARLDAWGVALDDVGAEEGSLALLPFLRPDVVKLDMSLVQGVPEQEGATITAAVRAYAERTGAVILAEGIETKEHEKLARIFGATYAQGYYYGRPGPLPDVVPPPRNVIPLRQQLSPLAGMTPYEILSAQHESARGEIESLRHISRHLEDQSIHGGTASVLLIQLPDSSGCTEAHQVRYRELAQSNALTVVIGPDIPLLTQPRYQSQSVRCDSSRAGEHAVIVINPHYAAAFVSRDCGDPEASDRRADYIYTHNRDSVIAAARGFLQELKPDPTPFFPETDCSVVPGGSGSSRPGRERGRSWRR